MLRRVGLSDVIQMECLARNSSILEIYNQHVIGRIYIEEGQLVHAAGGDLVGEQALQKLLSLPGGSFELAQFEAPPQLTLSGPWEFLLMEAARMRDEMAANGPEVGIQVDPHTLSAPTEASAACLEETLDLFQFWRTALRGAMCRRAGPHRLAASGGATGRAAWWHSAARKF